MVGSLAGAPLLRCVGRLFLTSRPWAGKIMAQTLFPQLVNAAPKRMVVIGEGTHSVIMEKNRMQLFREVQMFFDEARN